VLVRALYTTAGAPEIPGYPSGRVARVLAGEVPADARFFNGLLRVLNRAVRREPFIPSTVVLRMIAELGTGSNPHLDALLETSTPENIAAVIASVMADRPDAVVDTGALQRTLASQSRPLSRMLVSAPTEAEAPQQGPHGFTPPNPETVRTAAEFVEALKLLQRWAGLKLRDVEAKSKEKHGGQAPAVWLPRSTVSDMFRGGAKGRLPKAAQVRAFAAVCGLSPADQDRWVRAHERLAAVDRVAWAPTRTERVYRQRRLSPSAGATPKSA
jgi:hypothetical protein